MIRTLIACAATAAAVAATAMPAWSEEVLRFKMFGKLDQIDPIWTTSNNVRDHGYLIYDTLFATDGNFEIQPQMVDTWNVSDDGLVYTFTLRDGLKFHDGAPVTSSDVIASLSRWMTKDTMGVLLQERLDNYEEVDASTFRINLKEPFGLLIAALGKVDSNVPFIMPARIVEAAGDDQIKEPIGSGPYRFVMEEWRPGVRAVYVKNEDYVPRSEPSSGLAGSKEGVFDRLERIDFVDDITSLNALVAGEIDFVDQFPADLIPLVESAPNVTWGTRGLGRNLQIVINWTQPPTDNVLIRQALQLALKQDDYMVAINGSRTELYQNCAAIFMCDGPYATDVNSERVMTQDFDRVKELLDQAGYDGTPITVLHATDIADQRDGGTVTVETLRRAGFVVDEQISDWASVTQRRASKAAPSEGGWNVFQTAFGGLTMMSPVTNKYTSAKCDEGWYGWPCDEELQGLLDAYIAESDEAARVEIAHKIQERSNEVVTFINMGEYVHPAAWSSRFQTFENFPISTNFWSITLK